MGETCVCGVPNWRKIRTALDLSQERMAEYCEISVREYRRAEENPHQCPPARAVRGLRRLLSDIGRQGQLAFAEVSHPFPEDLQTPYYFGRDTGGPRCSVCDVPHSFHPRCVKCGELAGPGHPVPTLDGAHWCASCRRAAETRLKSGRAS